VEFFSNFLLFFFKTFKIRVWKRNFFSIRFVSQIFSFLYLFCFKPLRNNLYFSFPLSTFIYSDNTALDTKIIFRCCNFYFLEETRRDGKSKIHLISLQKDNVRQQNPSNSCAERRKDALHNRKEPFDAHPGCRNGEKCLNHVAITIGFHCEESTDWYTCFNNAKYTSQRCYQNAMIETMRTATFPSYS
jgi:hypothetical protein